MKRLPFSLPSLTFLACILVSFSLVSCEEEVAPPSSDTGTTEIDSGEPEAPAGENSEKSESGGDETAEVDVKSEKKPMKAGKELDQESNPNLEVATIGGGCFWCTEAVLERCEGVVDVVSGYMGGHVDNPTYEQICTKTTGHAEVIQVTYDKAVLTFEDVLDIFWQAHDPTTLNQQGADKGPQYRSVIFYHSPEQKNLAEKSKAALDASGAYDDPAVTEITEASTFWEAEEYHQDYYVNNKNKNPYCRVVITPKMKKFGFE